MMAPMNFYVIATLAMVFFFAWTNIDFFGMKKHETRAQQTGELYDPEKEIPGQLKEEFPTHSHGRVRDLVAPIVTLVIVTLAMMIWTGYRIGGSMSIWTIFENTDVPLSLVVGGLAGTVLAACLYISQMKKNVTASYRLLGKAFVSGAGHDAGHPYPDFSMGVDTFDRRVGNWTILINRGGTVKHTRQLPTGYYVYSCGIDGIFNRIFLGLFRYTSSDCRYYYD